jgi:hypothetical protein
MFFVAILCRESQEVVTRTKARHPVTLPWISRVVKSKTESLESCGWVMKQKNGQDFVGSRTFCWNWLLNKGYLSRVSGNKRPNSPEDIRSSMKKWLHFVREEVLYKKATVDGTGGSAGSLDGVAGIGDVGSTEDVIEDADFDKPGVGLSLG